MELNLQRKHIFQINICHVSVILKYLQGKLNWYKWAALNSGYCQEKLESCCLYCPETTSDGLFLFCFVFSRGVLCTLFLLFKSTLIFYNSTTTRFELKWTRTLAELSVASCCVFKNQNTHGLC